MTRTLAVAAAIAFVAMSVATVPAASAAAEPASGQGFFNSGFPVTARGTLAVGTEDGLAYATGGGDALRFTLQAALLHVERHPWKETRVTDPLKPEKEWYGNVERQDVEEASFVDAVARVSKAGDAATLLAYAPAGGSAPRVTWATADGGGAVSVDGARERVLGTANDTPDMQVGESPEDDYLLQYPVNHPHVTAAAAGGVLRVEGNFTLYVWDADLVAQGDGTAPESFPTGKRDTRRTAVVEESEIAFARVHVTSGVLELRGASAVEVLSRALDVRVDGDGVLPTAVGGFRAGDTKYEAVGEDVTFEGDAHLALRLVDGTPGRALVDLSGTLTAINLEPQPAGDAGFLKSPAGRAAATGTGVLVLLVGAAVLVGRERVGGHAFFRSWVNPMRHPVPEDATGRLEAAVAALADGEDAEAVKLLQPLADADPENVVVLVDYGCALDRLGRPRDARDAFERAVTADPGNAEANYYYARALARLGLTASALPHLQRAVTLDPRLSEMAGKDAGFRSLADHPSFLSLVT